MTRRVLIVVSTYAPAMIADMHRARQLAWELPRFGWEVEILAPGSQFQMSTCMDPDSEGFFAPGAKVHYVKQEWGGCFERFGVRSIGWKALIPMLAAGARLLRRRHFAVVFVSTTQFPLFLLGPAWKRLTGTRYILDFHDPCYRKGSRGPVWTRSSIKHWAAQFLLNWVEAIAVRGADALVAVSPDYLEELRLRYGKRALPWMLDGHTAAIPFGVLPGDFDEVRRVVQERNLPPSTQPEDRTVAYVGAGGPIMRRSFGLLTEVLASLQDSSPEVLRGVVFDLRGTFLGWKQGDPCHLADQAAAAGVSSWVKERPGRVTYRESMEHLLQSDGAIVLGVEDDGYLPSKLFSYAWSGKPLLAVLRRQGPAYRLFQEHPTLGHALWFDHEGAMPLDEAGTILKSFLKEVQDRKTYDRTAVLSPFLAESMALRHAELFLRSEGRDPPAPRP